MAFKHEGTPIILWYNWCCSALLQLETVVLSFLHLKWFCLCSYHIYYQKNNDAFQSSTSNEMLIYRSITSVKIKRLTIIHVDFSVRIMQANESCRVLFPYAFHTGDKFLLHKIKAPPIYQFFYLMCMEFSLNFFCFWQIPTLNYGQL